MSFKATPMIGLALAAIIVVSVGCNQHPSGTKAQSTSSSQDRSGMSLGGGAARSGQGQSSGAGPVEVTGKLGSPSATTTIDGTHLPPPDPSFGGVIKNTAAESKPWWPPRIVPPKGAPNVLLIMTDDAGYGVASTFGGVIPTPALDRVAKMGLRYTQFHSTALCSPTRAALITGRNHHSSGFGVVSEQSTGFPGYNALIPRDKATIAAILKGNGYSTSWFGKAHNTPTFQYSAAGPFDLWPVGMGFEYFYGFMGGDSSQWQPFLFRNTSPVFPWVGKPQYNLITDMADDAIGYMKQLNASDPDKPFFVYYVPGATHAPHHPTPEWIDKISKLHLFDEGWNKLRERIFDNQKRLGVIPENTKLTPWPDDLPKWDTLSADEKKLFIRQADVFAAYAAYADHEIGRVIQAVEDMGKLDNTLIIYIEGDNGTSAEGSTVGTPSEVMSIQGVVIPPEKQLPFIPIWGTDRTYPHMSVAWSWAFDTPFRYTKQVASHFGGTRQGMCMAWPNRIKDAGGIRTQFHHVIDIVPTILEATGISAPDSVEGIEQKPIEGVSMAYTWDKANASAPSKRKTQYFEMFCNRGIYHEGWYACTTPPAPPWAMGIGKLPPIDQYNWELYNLSEDYSQHDDLAAKMPDKVKELQRLFMQEAAKYEVLPLDNDILKRLLTARPSATAGRDEFTYSGEIANIPAGNAPNILTRSFTISADVDVPAAGAEGVLVTDGGRFGGYGLYVLKGVPVFNYNLLGMQHVRWVGKAPLTPGKHSIVFDFTYHGPGFGKAGSGVLKVDGAEVASEKIEHTIPFILPWDETFDVGVDTRTPVDDKDYQVPFRFTGTLNRLTIKRGPPQIMSPAEMKAAQDEVERAKH